MNIDIGLAVVILAVLVFYLRLIIIQRQRVKRVAQLPAPGRKQSQKSKEQLKNQATRYSILSHNRRDWLIAGLGVLAIVIGVLLSAGVIPWQAVRSWWWVPTAAGIVAFSWAFKL